MESVAPTADARVLRGWHVAAALFCVLMCGLHVAAGLNSGGVTDFWRDAYWATVIAHGERFPLSGPPINNLLELGPWWFYLLALPIWLTHRIAAVSVFVQLLAAAKYPLAWRLGTRLVDARFGFAFAASMAIAGWSTAGLWFPSHPAVIETTVLLLAFAVWRCWDSFSIGNALLFGLAAAACVHAHPGTALYVVCGGLALLRRHPSLRGAAMSVAAAAVVVLSLAPPWFDTSPAVPNIDTSLASYATHEFGVDLLARIPRLLYGLVFGGAWTGFLVMTKWNPSTVSAAWWVYCACLAVVLVGVLRLRPERRRLRAWFVCALAFVVMQIAFLALIRPFTSIWMVPSCLPPLAFAIAIGWYGWFSTEPRPLRRAGLAAFALYVGLALAPFGLFLRDLQTVRVMDTNPMFNIGDIGDRYTTMTAPFVSVSAVDAIAGALCDKATLHLRLAAVVEGTSASAVRNACGRWPDLRYAGMRPDGAHIAGLPQSVVAAVGIDPDRVVAGMAFYSRVRAIAPVDGASVAGLRRMEVARRPPDESRPAPVAFDFDAGVDDVVAVTNRYPQFSSLTMREVTVNGFPAQALYADGRTFVYRCGGCRAVGLARWRLKLEGVTANLDVVVLPATEAVASTAE